MNDPENLTLKCDNLLPLETKQSADNKQKLEDFTKWFNSIYRLSIFTEEQTNKEEQIYLLLLLKKSIKYALTELNAGKNSKPYSFKCKICDELITAPKENFWSALEAHEHFNLLISGNTLEDLLPQIATIPSNTEEKVNNMTANEISLITQQLSNTSLNDSLSISNGISKETSESNYDTDSSDSNFKFNFKPKYDEIVESALYPAAWMKEIRSIDKVKDFTIQITCKSKAVCLLCPCELISTKKVSKKVVVDHIFGQRHLRNAANPVQVSSLEKYHQTFLNLETTYQSHQVYFIPYKENLQCNLCKTVIKHSAVQEHIDTNPHKANVLHNYNKGSDFKLVNNQVDIYGIAKEEIIKKGEEMNRERTTSGTEKDAKHNIIKSIDPGASKDILDLLPNRFKEHKKCMKTRPKTIFCESCKIDLPKDVNVIENHIKQQSHLKNSKIELKRYSYYCEICNVKFIDENSWNKHHTQGSNRHGLLTETRKAKVVEYECMTCRTIIYGDELSLIRHLSARFTKGPKKEAKLPSRVQNMFLNKKSVQDLGKRLSTEATEVLEDRQLNNDCCKAIEDLLDEVFPGCKAYPFGSRISGLGNYDSDLDVFLDIGGMYCGYKCQEAQDQALFVKKAEKVFRKNKNVMLDVLAIPTARTPIVKLYHIQTELDCDISFRHGLSVENTKFLRYCMELQPVTQTLILILKQWSHYLELNEHITTYALAMLVIFYMQTKKYLPSVKVIRELNPGPLTIIDGWETINYSVPVKVVQDTLLKYKGDTMEILIDFFKYYTVFDYNLLVVCPLMGRTISKKFFTQQNGEHLPEEMKPYKEKQKQDGEEFRALSPLCIQDPFDLSHNLTKACQIGTVTKFKNYCELSMKKLDEVNCK